MSAEPRGPACVAGDDEPGGAAVGESRERGGFATGARVGVEQVGVVEGRFGSHDMGHGELLAAPQVGAPLALRIRGTRGLESSCVAAMQIPARGYLLAATQRSVYLIVLAEHLNRPLPAEVAAAGVERVASLAEVPARADGGNVTQYVRLSLDGCAAPALVPRGAVFASVERAGDAASRQALGQCQLLGDVVPGAPLRLATASGHVIATSDVLEVSQGDAAGFRVATGNSVYILAPLVLPGAGSFAARG